MSRFCFVRGITRIKDLYESLDSKEGIIFDLGMVPTMKYYTGFMIKGYSDRSANQFYQEDVMMICFLDLMLIKQLLGSAFI
ncbi:MAG: hypothetical protein ACLR43_00755 [Faecalibacillus faecis]